MQPQLLQVLALVPLVLLLGVADAASDLSCNVMLSTNAALIKKKDGTSSCTTRVERAYRQCGSKAIVFTTYQVFEYQKKKVGTKPMAFMSTIRYRMPQGPGSGKLVLKSPDAALINDFSESLQECMLHAVKMGFTTIAITPHLDSPKKELWRNQVAFEPYANYGGTTYKDSILDPIVSALKAVMAKGVQVRLSIQGEMNMALAMYPKQWHQLLDETKKDLGPKAKVGVSMNWNKLCGEQCTFYPSSLFNAGIKNEYRGLMKAVDFIGVSSYPNVLASYKINPNKMDLDAALKTLDTEMKAFIGFGLVTLAAQGKQLQWSEFGVGGGCDSTAKCTATNIETIAGMTYGLVMGPYGRFKDPWKPKWAENFRYAFHQQALRKLSGGGPLPISFAFLWSTGSMDVCNVDPSSTTSKGTYASPSICAMINNYNKFRKVP